MPDSPEPHFPLPPGDERLLRRAWIAAHRLMQRRAEAEMAVRLGALSLSLEEERRRSRALEDEVGRLRRLIANRMRHPVVTGATDLGEIDSRLGGLEGVVSGEERRLRLEVTDLGGFVILGRLLRADGTAALAREGLLAFRLLDAEGEAMPQPDWLRTSDLYGEYRYISPDDQGWFERAVTIPAGAAWLELTAHDFRASLYRNDASRYPEEMVLSDLVAVPADILSWSMLARTDPAEHPAPDRPGALLVTSEGVRGALTLPAPVRAARFALSMGLEAMSAGTLTATLTARTGEAGASRTERLDIAPGQKDVTLGVQSETPFSQVLLDLRTEDTSGTMLLLDRSIDRVGTYPDPGIFRRLNAEQVAPATLDLLADDWERRGSWFCVHEDLTGYEGPLVLVRRVDPDQVPLMLGFAFQAAAGVAPDRRGLVCSILYFDRDGRRVALKDPEFALSPAVGNYKYVQVESRPCNLLTRIPQPEGASPAPAYLAIGIQAWNCSDYSHLSARPMLEPSSVFSDLLTDIQMLPESDSSHGWHGVFARSGSAWRRLRPASWRASCTDPLDEITIRFGPDAALSAWRDLGDLLWSPDTKRLREIVRFAAKGRVPLSLRLERLAAGAELPHQLVPAVDRVHVRPDQVDRVEGLLRPGATLDLVSTEDP